jgi:tRNA-2-methylthio-N6-dimethylallyladenosine synthase
MPRSISKSYFIKTFGCYANEADSNLIAGVLEDLGFSELKLPKFKNEVEEINYILKKADLFIVNSCSVRQKSEDKIYGVGKILNQFDREKRKRARVLLTGCVVGSAFGERKRYSLRELQQKTRNFNGYFSPSDIPGLIETLKKNGLIKNLKKIDVANVKRKKNEKNHAFVNISYGCDNFCSYCIVPYSRGGEVSRNKKEILQEIKCLVKNGTSEITLCGQNVNSWGLKKSEKAKIRLGSSQKLPFAQLLREVHRIKGLKKIDFISSNPFDFTNDLIEVIKLPKISNYIHIAVQSGNDEILRVMNRRYTTKEFLDLLKRIREVKPGVEIGTDLIVGFPGETKEQFMATVSLVKKAKFAVTFIAMYSPRKGTVAQMTLKDDVTLLEKKARHAYLTKIWKQTKK